ncbi:MAG: Ni/Fe-hydrogenase, b-type cytochrome subunit [Syntrophales bacterium]|nr:Ni/Fe-hydrogenase, b-type cytochrome subunit [Syntrophales bacterium]
MENGMIRKREWSPGYIIDHWVRFAAVAVLIFTGAYIHWPFLPGGAGGFLMAWMRFFHFVAAYALMLGLIVRVYMAFRSTFDRDWRDFSLPENLKKAPEMLGYYLFLKKSHGEYRKYNPLQALAYLFVAVIIVFAALTGAALYHGNLFGFIPAPGSFRWVNALLGGESYTRIWHILVMWFFVIFMLIHVYMGVLATMVYKDKSIWSMFTGYKLKHR